MKQNAMLAICVLRGLPLQHLWDFLKETFSLKKTAIIDMLGQELYDIGIDLSNQTDPEEFSEELLQMDGIRKVMSGEETDVYISNIEVYLTVCRRF